MIFQKYHGLRDDATEIQIGDRISFPNCIHKHFPQSTFLPRIPRQSCLKKKFHSKPYSKKRRAQ
ncbi:MAG: hypothetical protein HC845_10605 [Akkermansiaceae bacterium]|nr:hypothetical protein [Akkermansiaceae bacterium]